MYIPKINLLSDQAEILAFMKRFGFATVVTAKDSIPVATHLPFLVQIKNERIVLRAHFAKANPQWMDLEHNQVLVIFTEPHAYISPSNYEKELNVPTWNYIAVHAYGKASLLSDDKALMELMEETIDFYEASYRTQWDKLPHEFKMKMLNGIVGFHVEVYDLQAKSKLSQNKTSTEQDNIIHSLSQSKDTNERLIAEYMQHLNGKSARH